METEQALQDISRRRHLFSADIPFRLFPFSPFRLFFVLLLCACTSSAAPQVIIHPKQGESVQVTIEIADTPEKRSFGLMYRKDLPESHGMLFLFPREEPLSFWMKNTPLPLDIIFISSSRTIVSIAQHTTPFSEHPIPSGAPAQFVLEVNGGFCQRHHIVVGDQMDFPRVIPPPS